jgi:hypothetical protein
MLERVLILMMMLNMARMYELKVDEVLTLMLEIYFQTP